MFLLGWDGVQAGSCFFRVLLFVCLLCVVIVSVFEVGYSDCVYVSAVACACACSMVCPSLL